MIAARKTPDISRLEIIWGLKVSDARTGLHPHPSCGLPELTGQSQPLETIDCFLGKRYKLSKNIESKCRRQAHYHHSRLLSLTAHRRTTFGFPFQSFYDFFVVFQVCSE